MVTAPFASDARGVAGSYRLQLGFGLATRALSEMELGRWTKARDGGTAAPPAVRRRRRRQPELKSS